MTRDDGVLRGPLSGLRVIDLTQVVSGPTTTMLLGDLGAEVIKIEPPGGEVYRRSGPTITGEDGETTPLNILRFSRNKKSVVLDLKSEDGRAALKALIASGDVLVENFRPGVFARLGFDAETLLAINPRLIYATISGYGHSDVVPSSRESLPAYAMVVEAWAGLMTLAGASDGPPAWMGFAMADIFAGALSFGGIMLALYRRTSTGLGERVDVAMADGALLMNELAVLDYSATGEVLTRGVYAHQAPWGAIECADGYVAIALMTTPQWVALCALIDRPDWSDDSRFATGVGRAQSYTSVIEPALSAWAKGLGRDGAAAALLTAGIPASPVHDASDVIRDAGLERRQMFVDIVGTDGRIVRSVGNPIKLASVRGTAAVELAELGEHTDEVLAGVGYSAESLAVLRAAGVIGGSEIDQRESV